MLAKSSDKLFKIMSTDSVAAVKDIETDYEFQNWHYVTVNIYLLNETIIKSIYLDTKCSVTLLNQIFFRSQCSKVKVCTMITLILVQEIDSNKHIISEYVIILIHLVGIISLNQEIEAVII